MTAGQVLFGAGMMRPGSGMDVVTDLMMEKLAIGGREVNDMSAVAGCRIYVRS